MTATQYLTGLFFLIVIVTIFNFLRSAWRQHQDRVAPHASRRACIKLNDAEWDALAKRISEEPHRFN